MSSDLCATEKVAPPVSLKTKQPSPVTNPAIQLPISSGIESMFQSGDNGGFIGSVKSLFPIRLANVSGDILLYFFSSLYAGLCPSNISRRVSSSCKSLSFQKLRCFSDGFILAARRAPNQLPNALRIVIGLYFPRFSYSVISGAWFNFFATYCKS